MMANKHGDGESTGRKRKEKETGSGRESGADGERLK